MTTPSKDHAVRLAAELWYGGKGRSKQGTTGRARGRGDLPPNTIPTPRSGTTP